MNRLSKEELSDLRDEFRERRPRYTRCADRMCGADDCPNCHPENFRGGVLIEDLPENCPHDDHDHGICLDCGKDITDDLVAKAEEQADAQQER